MKSKVIIINVSVTKEIKVSKKAKTQSFCGHNFKRKNPGPCINKFRDGFLQLYKAVVDS
jgi:hypothetical protein